MCGLLELFADSSNFLFETNFAIYVGDPSSETVVPCNEDRDGVYATDYPTVPLFLSAAIFATISALWLTQFSTLFVRFSNL